MKYPVIETERLFLRRPDARDQMMAMRQFGAGQHRLATLTLSEGRAWRQLATFLAHWDSYGYGLFAVVPEGCDTPMGLVGAWHPAGWDEPEIGWQIWSATPDAADLSTEAIEAVRDFAYGTLGWRECVSYVGVSDPASASLALAVGGLRDPMADLPRECDGHVYRHPPARRRLARVA